MRITMHPGPSTTSSVVEVESEEEKDEDSDEESDDTIKSKY